MRVAIFLLCFLQCILVAVSDSTKGMLFRKQTACVGMTVQESRCTLGPYPTLGSVRDCSRQCQHNDSCKAFLVNKNLQNSCKLCTERIRYDDCSYNGQLSLGLLDEYDKLECPYNGTVKGDYTCDCGPGYTGSWCEHMMIDCEDWLRAGYGNGVYWLKPTVNTQPFQMYCAQEYAIRQYLLVRRTPSVDFYRDWNSYANGFGDMTADHWFGLKHWSELTNARCYILFAEFNAADGRYWMQHYVGFRVANESQGFTFDFDSTSFYDYQLGDCFTHLLGNRFSTYDVDNDGDVTQNCAQRRHSGWWMGGASCSVCNPTGTLWQLANETRLGTDGEVFWVPDTIGNYSPHTLSMWLQRC